MTMNFLCDAIRDVRRRTSRDPATGVGRRYSDVQNAVSDEIKAGVMSASLSTVKF